MKQLKRKVSKTKAKKPGSQKRRPVASHHRKVHKSVAGLIITVWLVVIACTAIISYGYFEHHRTLHINQRGISLSVTNVSYDDFGQPPFSVPPGWKFVYVDVLVVNTRQSVFNFAPVIQTYLTDSSGRQYGMSPTILPHPIAGGPIGPNRQRVGTLSYLVPIKAKDVAFHFSI